MSSSALAFSTNAYCDDVKKKLNRVSFYTVYQFFGQLTSCSDRLSSS